MTKPKPGESAAQPLPTQYIQSNMNFPLDEPYINEGYVEALVHIRSVRRCRSVVLRFFLVINLLTRFFFSHFNRIWTHYQRLAISIRRGCSTVESTLFPAAPSAPSVANTPSFSRKNTAADDLSVQFSMRNGPTPAPTSTFGLSPKKATPGLSHSTSFSSLNQTGGTSTRSGAAEGESSGGATVEASMEYAVGLLSALPASDHALAYVVLDTGVSVCLCLVSSVASFVMWVRAQPFVALDLISLPLQSLHAR